MNIKKQSFWQIVFEFLSIVFAVLLALGLNSYKQNMDLKKESELLTGKIIRECQQNLLELDTVIIRNEKAMRYLDSLSTVDEVSNFGISFSSELLASSAWKFTQASKSYSYMETEFLDEATTLYERQDYYMLISNQMFQNLGDMIMLANEGKPETMVSTSSYYMRNLLASSKDLQNDYRNFLKNHKK